LTVINAGAAGLSSLALSTVTFDRSDDTDKC
jgi:hypothetical protein